MTGQTTADGPTTVRPRPEYSSLNGFTAADELGNAVCVGCFEGGMHWAARQNAMVLERRKLPPCGCPPEDRRMPEIETRAHAVSLLREVLDELDRLDHELTCRCPGCRARLAITDESWTGSPS